MLRAFVNAFKIPDLRKKILFTLFIIAIYRFGSHVPVPVVNIEILQRQLEAQGAQGFLNFIDFFSGGALTRMAVFGLGIMPYITSSIIMQLLVVVIPKLERWQKEGETGIKKINQATRYVTVVLALLQSTGLV
ncbi:MAG: preprotein translocase subunit SecY, partial [Actinomycetota bacterium]